MSVATELVKLEHLTFHYGKQRVFSDLSLQIMAGESVVILGANGSGKSTLLKILGGLHFPLLGRYWAYGREVTEKILAQDVFGIEFRTRTGFVFQNSDAQLFNPTVEEEVAFGPSQLGLSSQEIRNRVRSEMERFGIVHLAERSPFALSGGEKRKVALASVLVMSPDLLLLDEPTAGLDPRSARVLLDVLLENREKGKTLVTSTHDLHLVPELASRVLVMDERGNLVADGDPRAVLSDKSLLRACNLVHVHRHLHNGQWHEHEHDHGFAHDHQHEHE